MRRVLLALVTLLLLVSTVRAQDGDTGGWTLEGCLRCDQIYNLAFSPDGKILAVAASDGLTLYDNSNHFLPHLYDQTINFDRHYQLARLTEQENTYEISWSHDGKYLAAFQGEKLSKPEDAHLRVWDVAARRIVRELATTTTYITFDWSPMENVLAYGDDDHVKLWNAEKNTFIEPIALYVQPAQNSQLSPPRDLGLVWRFAWKPNGTQLAVSTQGNEILLYNPATDLIEKSFEIKVLPWEKMIWKPDGNQLLILRENGNNNFMIDLQTGKVARYASQTTTALWSPSGKSLYEAPWLVWVTQPDSERIVAIAWSPDGSQVAFGGSEASIYVRELQPGDEGYEGPPDGSTLSKHEPGRSPVSGLRRDQIYSLDWSPNGHFLAVAATDGVAVYDDRYKLVARLVDGAGGRGVAWNYDGTLLASTDWKDISGNTSTLKVWDASTWKLKTTLPTRTSYVGFDWSPKENVLAYSNGWAMTLWNADTDELHTAPGIPEGEVFQPRAGRGYIWQIIWSADGQYIIVGTGSGSVLRWNTTTQSIDGYAGGVMYENDSLALDPRGGQLIVAPENLDIPSLYDWRTGKLEDIQLPGPKVPFASMLSWSPDGTLLVSGGFHDTALWNTATWQRVGTLFLQGGLNRLTAVAWSPDGKQLALGSDAGRIYIWHRPE